MEGYLKNNFEKNVAQTIEKYSMLSKGDRVLTALSGGADSSALLYVLKRLSKRYGITLAAAHLNHGIRGDEAKRDMLFAQELARSLDVPFYSKTVCVPKYCSENKMSEEAAGRELRYAFFNELCTSYGFNKIAVAHNKNDKAETVLLNMIRGSGAAGLYGIREVNGSIIRPLINEPRSEIEKYAAQNDIHYVTDSTNSEDIYCRNIVRNRIIPKMESINEAAVNNIIRCSTVLSDENDFLSGYVSSLNAFSSDGGNIYISRGIFEKQHIAVKRRLLINALCLVKGTLRNISSVHIDSIINNIKTGNTFPLPELICVTVEPKEIRVSNYPPDSEDKSYEYFPKIPGKITVGETNTEYIFEILDNLQKKEDNCVYLSYDKICRKSVSLRTYRCEDAFAPSGMSGTKKLKKFFVDNKIPKSERRNYPLLAVDGEIAAVIPLRVSRNYIINEGTGQILKITVSGGKNVRTGM